MGVTQINPASVISSLQQPITKKLFFSESFWKLPGKLVEQAEVVAFYFILTFEEVSQANSELDQGRKKLII